jgi:hypothetical protein
MLIGTIMKLSSINKSKKIIPFNFENTVFDMLCKVCASLVARSPRTRHTFYKMSEQFMAEAAPAYRAVNPVVVAINQESVYKAAYQAMKGGGKFAIIISDLKEFCFGDGFLTTANKREHIYNPKLIIPILPNISILYYRPLSYNLDVNSFVYNATQSEVDQINLITQIYSEKIIAYRTHAPILNSYFRQAQYLQIKYHSPEIFSKICDHIFSSNFYKPEFELSFG